MDNNDNHLKSPQTGGLKLMTVFIVVLALHVVVIGAFAIHGLMTGGGADADLADKTHKTVKIATDADAPLPDGSTAPAPDAASNPSTAATTPAPEASTATDMNPDAAEPPAPPATTTASTTPSPAPDANASSTPATPDASMTAATAPAPVPAPIATTSTPSGPLASGPVVTPPAPVQNDETAEQEAMGPTAPDAVIAPPKPYTVKLHDSLAKIAHRNHVSVAKLRETNNLKTDMLRIGQKLMIPAATEVAATDSAKAPASTPASNGPDRTLLGDDVPNSAVPSKKMVASTSHDEALVMPTGTSSRHTYTVVKGDTLSKIAHKFHMTTSTLMAANDAVDARKLRIGQKLHIPSQGSRSANIAAPAPVAPPEVPRAQPEPAEIQPIATPSAQLANFMP